MPTIPPFPSPSMHGPLRRKPIRGHTFVELLVAWVLGLLVLAVLAAAMGPLHRALLWQQTQRQMSEDARFALEELAREFRMAGFIGCPKMAVTDGRAGPVPDDVRRPERIRLLGSRGPHPLSAPAFADAQAQVLTPSTVLRGFDDLPSDLFQVSVPPGGRPAGAAVFMARAGSDTVALGADMPDASAPLQLTSDPHGWRQVRSEGGVHDFIVSDCHDASVFRGRATFARQRVLLEHGEALGNRSSSLGPAAPYMAGAVIAPWQWRLFYLMRRRGASTSSLYRIVYDGNRRLQAEELVGHVETLRIHYAENVASGSIGRSGNDAEDAGHGSADQQVWRTSASQVGDWSRISAVRIGVVMVSTETGDGLTAHESDGLFLLDQVYRVPPGATRRWRRAYELTVALPDRMRTW